MTQRQINQLEMAHAVQNYLNANTATWTTVPIVTTFKNELDELLLRIEENAEAQEASRIYMGEAKANQKRLIAEKTDILKMHWKLMPALMSLPNWSKRRPKPSPIT